MFVKLCNTCDISFVKQCQDQFNFTLSSGALERRCTKFMRKFSGVVSVPRSFRVLNVAHHCPPHNLRLGTRRCGRWRNFISGQHHDRICVAVTSPRLLLLLQLLLRAVTVSTGNEALSRRRTHAVYTSDADGWHSYQLHCRRHRNAYQRDNTTRILAQVVIPPKTKKCVWGYASQKVSAMTQKFSTRGAAYHHAAMHAGCIF